MGDSLSETGYLVATLEASVSYITQVRCFKLVRTANTLFLGLHQGKGGEGVGGLEGEDGGGCV